LSNIAIGYQAGYNLTGDNNIEIGNLGAAADTNTIRVGKQGTQTATYIAGIAGSAVSGSDVVVNNSGRLGIVASSARYKRDIHDMGESSHALMKLHPVTFHYRDDGERTTQYGLIAEEVEPVYPELVVRDTEGRVESVRYSMLTSMLLNELQKQNSQLQKQAAIDDRLKAQINELKRTNEQERAGFERRLAALERGMGDRKLVSAYDR